MSNGKSMYEFVPVGNFLREDVESVDPRQSPKEVFDLWSIPAHDNGTPEIVTGAEVGSHKKLVKPGDVLLSKIVPHIQRSRVVDNPDANRRIIASTEWIVFSGELIHARFLREVLTSEFFHRRFMETITGVGGSLARANPKAVSRIKIPLPPIAEQLKIAEILRTWDEAIETAEAELKAKQERKRWMMDKFMSRRPVQFVSGRELRIGTIEQFELAGIITLSRGKVISKKDIEGLPGTYPVYSSSIHNNGLFGRYGDYMFDEEMITWSVDGGGNFFHRPKHRFSITNVCGCMQVDTKRINCAFLASQLQYLHKRLTFDYQSKAHPSVIRKMYNLWIPSIEEQVSMADAMAICDEQMLNLNNRIKALCAQKRGLMQKLLTGEVRVAA